MKTVRVKLRGVSDMIMGKPFFDKRETGETHEAFEERTWPNRMHVDANGEVYIPARALKNTLSECAKFLSETVPGKGKATFTKHFEAGIMILEPMKLGIKAKDVKPLPMFVPADGKKGGTTRVFRKFPVIPEGWEGETDILVLDPTLEGHIDKIEEYLKHAGKFIGLMSMRPRKGGEFGRFELVNFKNGKSE